MPLLRSAVPLKSPTCKLSIVQDHRYQLVVSKTPKQTKSTSRLVVRKGSNSRYNSRFFRVKIFHIKA